ARGAAARRMMQAADRDERRPAFGDDGGKRLERAADDMRRRLIDAGKRRRIAHVEVTAAALGQLDHAIDILRIMKPFDLFAARRRSTRCAAGERSSSETNASCRSSPNGCPPGNPYAAISCPVMRIIVLHRS